VTTVLLKASLGSEQYPSMNSRMAWSYERFELVEVAATRLNSFWSNFNMMPKYGSAAVARVMWYETGKSIVVRRDWLAGRGSSS
jgi:hypothetical protein